MTATLDPMTQALIQGLVQTPGRLFHFEQILEAHDILLKENPVLRAFIGWARPLLDEHPKLTTRTLKNRLVGAKMLPPIKAAIEQTIDLALEDPAAIDDETYQHVTHWMANTATLMKAQAWAARVASDIASAKMETIQAVMSELAVQASQLAQSASVVYSKPSQVLLNGQSYFTVMKTGIDPLDHYLEGGIKTGMPFFAGIPSGHGKTTLTINMARAAVLQQVRTLIIETEMPASYLMTRVLISLSSATMREIEYFIGEQMLQQPLLSDELREKAEKMMAMAGSISKETREELLAWLDVMDQYLIIHGAPVSSEALYALVQTRIACDNVQVVLLDHFQGVELGTIGTQQKHVYFGSMLQRLIHLCERKNVALVVFGQLAKESERAVLTGKYIGTYEFMDITAARQMAAVQMVGCRSPDEDAVSVFHITKSRLDPGLGSFKVGFVPSEFRYRNDGPTKILTGDEDDEEE